MDILMWCELSYSWIVVLVMMGRGEMGVCAGRVEGVMGSGICLWRDRRWGHSWV